MDEPFLEAVLKLEKMPGKGGWTFLCIPAIPLEKRNAFGWRKVSGYIDNYQLKDHSLMPMKSGQLFMPVKAAIRKVIGKEAGELVKITLYADRLPTFTASDFLLCLEDEPEALAKFQAFNEQEREKYYNWIAAEPNEEARIERIVQAIDKISRGEKFK